MRRFSLLAALALAACLPAGEVSSGAPQTWDLAAMNGKPLPGGATIQFGNSSQLLGRAPCNTYFAVYGTTADPTALTVMDLGSSRMACENIAAESAYFNALSRVTRRVVSNGTMVLTGPGVELRYVAR